LLGKIEACNVVIKDKSLLVKVPKWVYLDEPNHDCFSNLEMRELDREEKLLKTLSSL